MRTSCCSAVGLRRLALVMIVSMVLTIIAFHGKGAYKSYSRHIHQEEDVGAKGEVGMELYPTGSRLPDCSHACGPCFPCKRVMVSFKCSTAEPCPIVYRCTCKGKFYHVPSN